MSEEIVQSSSSPREDINLDVDEVTDNIDVGVEETSINPNEQLKTPQVELEQTPQQQPELPKQNAAPLSRETAIDWFHFETRIRKVIHEVVEPLTKKQFLSFDIIEDLRRQIGSIQQKHEDTTARIDRIAKRNEAIDQLERKFKECDNEIVISKAIQRNDIMNVSEKVETLNQKVKVCQMDILNFSRFDDKIKKVQQTILEVTDEYNQTVTARMKEVSSNFIKQVQDLDFKHRESHRDLQKVLVKIDGIHDFAGNNEQRFSQLQAFINELRESFEESRIQQATGRFQSNDNAIEIKLKTQIEGLEKELQDFRKVQSEQDHEIKNNLHSMTNNRIEQLIFQNQTEMFDRVFQLKTNNSPPSSINKQSIKQRRDSVVMQSVMHDFQEQMSNNYQRWKFFQVVAKGRREVKTIIDEEPQSIEEGFKRMSTIAKILIRGGGDSEINESSHNSIVPDEADLYANEQILAQKELLQARKMTEFDEDQKQKMEQLQRIDQNTMLLGSKELSRDSQFIKFKGRQSLISTESPNILMKSLGPVEPSDSEDEESDSSQNKQPRARLNSFLQSLNLEQIQSLISQQLMPLQDQMKKFETTFQDTLTSSIEQLSLKLSHDPLLNMISRHKILLDNVKEDVQRLKENQSISAIQTQVQRVEVSQSLLKNDIQQQLYKIKEFQEQLYLKSVEHSDKLDYEIIKLKKADNDLSGMIDKIQPELRVIKNDASTILESMMNLTESICVILELESITSALEQQDEIDRRQQENQNLIYNPTSVKFMNKEFQRYNLIFCRRTILDNLFTTLISTRQPFTKSIQEKYKNHTESASEVFWKQLISKLTKISGDFQSRLDSMQEERAKQEHINNRGTPQEVKRIKDQLQINEQPVTNFKKNINFEQSRNTQFNSSLTREPQNLLRNRHSVIENYSNSNLLPNINQNMSQDRLPQRRHQGINIGNVEHLPKHAQPIKGPNMLLQSQKQRNITLTGGIIQQNTTFIQQSAMMKQQQIPMKQLELIQNASGQQFKALEVNRQAVDILNIQPQTHYAVNLQIPTLIMSKDQQSPVNYLQRKF